MSRAYSTPKPSQRNRPPSEMTEREFVVQYVLNRASVADNLNGDMAAREALKAWKVINETRR